MTNYFFQVTNPTHYSHSPHTNITRIVHVQRAHRTPVRNALHLTQPGAATVHHVAACTQLRIAVLCRGRIHSESSLTHRRRVRTHMPTHGRTRINLPGRLPGRRLEILLGRNCTRAATRLSGQLCTRARTRTKCLCGGRGFKLPIRI